MERADVFQDDPSGRSPLALDQDTLLNDQFRVGRVLGVGGFGITYLAFDEVLEMVVAVKEYLPNDIAVRKSDSHTVQPLSSTGEGGKQRDFEFGLKRFLQEARTLAKFEAQENIVRVRTFFEENGTGYLVMNFYEGRTLAEYLAARNGFLPETEALLIMEQIMDGLKTVHAEDILHRDIDPNNVYLADNGTVVLLDFGAARSAVGERTQSMSVVLKRGYAPHEQYHSHGDQGPWTDVYACSATLYRTLTGYKPPEAAARILDDNLADPKELVPSLSDATNEAVLKGLSIRPTDRPQTVTEFRGLLPDPPPDATPGWIGEVSTRETVSGSLDGPAELQVTSSHACRLYVDGSKTAELDAGQEYTLGVDAGSHRIRAVRTDRATGGRATVTASGTTIEGKNEDVRMSLDSLVWQDVVSMSANGATTLDIDFTEADDPAGDGAVGKPEPPTEADETLEETEAAPGSPTEAAPTAPTEQAPDLPTPESADEDEESAEEEPATTEAETVRAEPPSEPSPDDADGTSPDEDPAETEKADEAIPSDRDADLPPDDGADDSPPTEDPEPAEADAVDEAAPTESDAEPSDDADLASLEEEETEATETANTEPTDETTPSEPDASEPTVSESAAPESEVGETSDEAAEAEDDSAAADASAASSDEEEDREEAEEDLDEAVPAAAAASASDAPDSDSGAQTETASSAEQVWAQAQAVAADVGAATQKQARRLRAALPARSRVAAAAELVRRKGKTAAAKTNESLSAFGPYQYAYAGLAVVAIVGVLLVGWWATSNSRPQPRPDRAVTTTGAEGEVVVNLSANDRDPDSTGVRVTRAGFVPDSVAQVALIDSARMRIEPDSGFVGTARIPYTVADPAGDTAHSHVTLQVPFNGRRHLVTQELEQPQVVHTDSLGRDGNLDVLVAALGNRAVTWSENTRSGTSLFKAPKSIDDAVDGAVDVTTADLTGNGRIDVLSASLRGDAVAWYENQGNGSFSEPKLLDASANGAAAVRTADVDRDGDLDVVAGAVLSETVSWYENQGNGQFSEGRPIATNISGLEGLHVSDLDRDSIPDVLVVSYKDSSLHRYEPASTSDSVQFVERPPVGRELDEPITVHTTDLSGNGREDVLVGTVGKTPLLYIPNRTAAPDSVSFGPKKVLARDIKTVEDIATGDLDGDGDADVFGTAFASDTVVWIENRGDGTFSAAHTVATGVPNVISLALADVNRDGTLDVLTASQADNTIGWYENHIRADSLH